MTNNPLAAREEAYQVQVGAGPLRVQPGIQMNGSCAGRSFVRFGLQLGSGEDWYLVVLPQGAFAHRADLTKPLGKMGASAVRWVQVLTFNFTYNIPIYCSLKI